MTTAGTPIAPNTQLGTLSFTGTNGTATTTFNATGINGAVMLSPNTDTTFIVKGDISGVGGNSNVAVGSGHIVQVNYLNSQGTSVGKTVYGAALSGSGVQGVLIYRSFPSFTYPQANGVAQNGATPNMLSLTVAANGSGPVTLYQLRFLISTTTATFTLPTFTGPTGNVGSVVLSPDGTNVTVTFNSVSNQSDAVISAGSSKTYNLGGTLNLTGTNSTGQVSIKLAGDTQLPAFTGNVGGLAATSTIISSGTTVYGNTIWSPMSTTTVVGTTGLNDWTNSYGDQVTGSCYQLAGLGTNCAATSLSR
jgi:hypothetical protein